MNLIFYLNGRFVPESEAKVSILDLGFVRGYGVFDFLRTYNGKPFKLDEHLKRLAFSADQIGLQIPPISQIRQITLQTLKKNTLPEANIKIIVSGGVSPDQITPADNPTLAILVYPLKKYPKEYYEKGIKVITYKTERSFATAKTTNYLTAVVALAKARKEKAVEAIYINDQAEVLEATISNFFVFRKNVLITPKDGILLGITREVVLELAKKEFKVELRPIKYSELKTVDEAFITASNKEIMPVVKIDGITVGDGKVGERTKQLIELFRRYTLLSQAY